MRSWLVCVTAVGLLTVSAGANARQRPDFSGTWVATPDAAAPATGRPALPNYGPQISITHAEPALTLTRTLAGAPATIKYVLDGSEVASRMPARLCEADSGAKWTAAWDGSAVVITLVGAVPPNGKAIKMDVRSTLTLGIPGYFARRRDGSDRRTNRAAHDDDGLQADGPAITCPRARAEGTGHDGAGGMDCGGVDRGAWQLDDRGALDASGRWFDARRLPYPARRPHACLRIPLHRRTRRRAGVHRDAERPVTRHGFHA